MSFLAQIRGGLASARQEVSKHVNAANVYRTLENARNSTQLDRTTPQLGHLHTIATRLGGPATIEKQDSLNNATPSLAEIVKDNNPHVEDNAARTTGNIEAEETTEDANIIGECSSIDAELPEPSCEEAVSIHAQDDQGSASFMSSAQAAAQRLGQAAWENPAMTAATVTAGAGLAVVAAPAIVTVPFMSLAGAAGFTPTGIAAYSTASAIHASIGNVAAGSLFATVQSAAAGGYGVAAVTGAAQAAGGAVAGVSGLGGLVTYFRGKGKLQSGSTTDVEKKQKQQ